MHYGCSLSSGRNRRTLPVREAMVAKEKTVETTRTSSVVMANAHKVIPTVNLVHNYILHLLLLQSWGADHRQRGTKSTECNNNRKYGKTILLLPNHSQLAPGPHAERREGVREGKRWLGREVKGGRRGSGSGRVGL